MKFAVFAALMALTLPEPALAADWVLVGTSHTGSKFFIDRQSIRTMQNGYKRAWVRGVYGKIDVTGTTHYRSFEEYDCGNGRRRWLQNSFFTGEKMTENHNTPSAWTYVAPETVNESRLHFVCF